jgi:hypothetical protein
MIRRGYRWELERRYRLVFAGYYARAEVDPPQMEAGDRVLLVRRMWDAAKRPEHFCHPGHIILALRARLAVARLPTVCEACDGQLVVVRGGLDSREDNQRVIHAATHLGMRHEGWPGTEADAILGTGENALPTTWALKIPSPQRAVELQPYATPWLIHLQWWHARTPWRERGIYGVTAEQLYARWGSTG